MQITTLTTPQVVIGGEKNIITLKLLSFLSQFKFYHLIKFLRSNRYKFMFPL